MTDLLIHPDQIPLYPEQVVAEDREGDRHHYTRLLNDIVECYRQGGGWYYVVHILFTKEHAPRRLTRHAGTARYRHQVIPAAKRDIATMRRRLHAVGGL